MSLFCGIFLTKKPPGNPEGSFEYRTKSGTRSTRPYETSLRNQSIASQGRGNCRKAHPRPGRRSIQTEGWIEAGVPIFSARYSLLDSRKDFLTPRGSPSSALRRKMQTVNAIAQCSASVRFEHHRPLSSLASSRASWYRHFIILQDRCQISVPLQ